MSNVVLVVTTEKSGLDKYSQEIGKRIGATILNTKRYFSLTEACRFVMMLRKQNSILHLTNQHFGRHALFLKAPFLITVHDLVRCCLDLERGEEVIEKILLKLDIRGIKKASHIITISQNTKNDLMRYLKIPEERITVVYTGVDHGIFKPCETKAFEGPYILYVGSERPRKNLATLLKAFSIIKGEFEQLKLVKVGSYGRATEYRQITIDHAASLGITEDIIFVEHVPEDSLPSYYSSASLLAYPSLYEGFGLPPLEAMACGCPVITSNTSSLPEVVGDAGIMVDPYDVDGLAKAMREVLTNDGLRSGMIERGLAQAEKFSWEKTARETCEVYERIGAL